GARAWSRRALHASGGERRLRSRRPDRLAASVADGRAGLQAHGLRRGHSVPVSGSVGAARTRRLGLRLASCVGSSSRCCRDFFPLVPGVSSSSLVLVAKRPLVACSRPRSERIAVALAGLAVTYGSASDPLTVNSAASTPPSLGVLGSGGPPLAALAARPAGPREVGTGAPAGASASGVRVALPPGLRAHAGS